MSLARLVPKLAIATVLVAALSSPALAQNPDQGTERFFFDQPEKKSEKKETLLRGSIVSTSFYYTERAGVGTPYNVGDEPPLTASPFDRLFTDLRLQLSAKHISGGDWDFRGDVRGRYNTGGTRLSINRAESPYMNEEVPVQSGTFSGNELDIREFWVGKTGEKTDFQIGRQFALELAGTKFDGVQIKYRKSEKVNYLLFGGAYPVRGSRDIREDYPEAPPLDVDGEPGARVMPAVAGGGLSYRYDRYYGSFGGVGIIPLSDELERFGGTGTQEKPRVFVTANGYYRRSTKLDLFHFAIVDATSSDGAGLRNLTLGANYQPDPALRVFADVTRVDAETLRVQAQTKLDEPDPNGVTAVQNNIDILRIASESARLGVSSALKRNRFQVSVYGTLRRRPEIVLTPRDIELGMPIGGQVTTLDEQRGADVTLSVVDRRFRDRYRVGLSGSRSFPIGDANVAKTKVLIVRGDIATELKEGKAEVEGHVSFVDSEDDRRNDTCTQLQDLTQCFGTSKVRTYTVGGLGFYRIKREWFLMGSLNLGYQTITAVVNGQNGAAPVSQPPITSATAFGRIAYRF